MSPRMTHICLHVSELDDCVRFYRRYCGMDVIDNRSDEGVGSVYMAERGREQQIVLQLKSGGESLKLKENDERHFGFSVESRETVDAIARCAREDSILFWEPDEYLPGAYLCAVKDPNGNCVEFAYGHPVPPT